MPHGRIVLGHSAEVPPEWYRLGGGGWSLKPQQRAAGDEGGGRGFRGTLCCIMYITGEQSLHCPFGPIVRGLPVPMRDTWSLCVAKIGCEDFVFSVVEVDNCSSRLCAFPWEDSASPSGRWPNGTKSTQKRCKSCFSGGIALLFTHGHVMTDRSSHTQNSP